MQLLDHVSISVRDLARGNPFYRALMTELGAPEAYDEPRAIGFGERNALGDDTHSCLRVRVAGRNRIELVSHEGDDIR